MGVYYPQVGTLALSQTKPMSSPVTWQDEAEYGNPDLPEETFEEEEEETI